MWRSKSVWCLGWQTVTQDPHLTHWRRESTLLDSPTSHPSPKNEATCLSTNLIQPVKKVYWKQQSLSLSGMSSLHCSSELRLFIGSYEVLHGPVSWCACSVLVHDGPQSPGPHLPYRQPGAVVTFFFLLGRTWASEPPLKYFLSMLLVSTLGSKCSPSPQEKCAVEIILWVLISFFWDLSWIFLICRYQRRWR